ncbi:hypothetical protein QBC36DRAFT_285810 [Triangularia setosa]|uniref:Uncharacterized protein n=1 Tax=Triangularia setosa TaxID=2587417 RepID=A0AAN7ACC2_9PEZI|nr:hypothetical protein QBC36DRAFT_285810 [Podospora setosa]
MYDISSARNGSHGPGQLFDRWRFGVGGPRLKMVELEMEDTDVLWWGDVMEGYQSCRDSAEEIIVKVLEQTRWNWVQDGLRKMKGLRNFEVDNDYPHVKFRKGGKVEWVRRLEKD